MLTMPRWTQEERDLLRSTFSTAPNSSLSAHFKKRHTRDAILRQASRMGLRKTRERRAQAARDGHLARSGSKA